MSKAFSIANIMPSRDGFTISQNAKMGAENNVTYFFLGEDTSISRESYDTTTLYLGSAGSAEFLLGEDAERVELTAGDLLMVPGETLCGVECAEGAVYTEIIINKEVSMNKVVNPGQALKLKDLISYEKGSIVNLDIAKNDTMKYVLMAFDEGTGLTPHRAPGNALVTALEGEAVIGYEGEDHVLKEGESFRFAIDGLHSVTANQQFKMSLLLVLE